jgi:hypothetical protein
MSARNLLSSRAWHSGFPTNLTEVRLELSDSGRMSSGLRRQFSVRSRCSREPNPSSPSTTEILL